MKSGWLMRALRSVEKAAASWPKWRREAASREEFLAIPAPTIEWVAAEVDFGNIVGRDGITRRMVMPSVIVPKGTKVGQFIIPRDYTTGGIVLSIRR